jgi:hypothetical protein
MDCKALEQIRENLDASLDELAAHLEAAPAQALAETDIDKIAVFYELIDRIKKTVDSARKCVNKAVDHVASHLCEKLVQGEYLPYRNELGSFSPSATIFPSIKDPATFLAWLETSGAEDPMAAFMEAATLKTPLRKRCEALFENGENLPDGIEGHCRRRVRITRKRKGLPTDGEEKSEF